MSTCEDESGASLTVCSSVTLDAGPREPFAVVHSHGVLAIRHWRVTAELGGHWCDVLIRADVVADALAGIAGEDGC